MKKFGRQRFSIVHCIVLPNAQTFVSTKVQTFLTNECMQKVQLGDRRSVEIEPSDKKAIKAILKYAGTKTAAATLIGMGRGTFSQMAKPETRTCANDSRELIRAFAKGNPAVIAGAVAPTKGTVKVQRERKIA